MPVKYVHMARGGVGGGAKWVAGGACIHTVLECAHVCMCSFVLVWYPRAVCSQQEE
jgi:hypothetical protein